MVEAVIGAMQHAATLDASNQEDIMFYSNSLRQVMHRRFVVGQGTRDMQGPSGLTTEAFIDTVADRLHRVLNGEPRAEKAVVEKPSRRTDTDTELVKQLFSKFDTSGDGTIDFDEFREMMDLLGVSPKKYV